MPPEARTLQRVDVAAAPSFDRYPRPTRAWLLLAQSTHAIPDREPSRSDPRYSPRHHTGDCPIRPKASSTEQYLQAWHTRHPEAGSIFTDARDLHGVSSLDRLAAMVVPNAVVLDLACGAGVLCDLVARSRQPRQILGADFTRPELERAVLRAPRAAFVQAGAQHLPCADASIDVVLCHMALMLFDDVEAVLREIGRVLRPEGTFGAVTNAASGLDPVATSVATAVRASWSASAVALRPPAIGDSRTQDVEALRELLSVFFRDVSVEPFSVAQHVPRAAFWDYLAMTAYGFDALSADDGSTLIARLALPDPIPWTLPLLHISATRS